MKPKHTGGNWDRDLWPAYFIACAISHLEVAAEVNEHVLLAVNEIESDKQADLVDAYANKKKIFIDSGVYNLSVAHAKRHGLSMNEALSLAPTEIDGFDELFERYVSLLKLIGDKVWGYIEIDLGGRENKIKTRAKLESLGLRPTPVYHPLNDGWDYFDYLAERYDRICFGNVVMADSNTRKRLIATAWERRRKYPHLWIHALGMTPSETTTAFPMNSCDSSTWIAATRWGVHRALTSNAHPSDLGLDWIYRYNADGKSRSYDVSVRMCAYDAAMMDRTMRQIADDQESELGADIGMFMR